MPNTLDAIRTGDRVTITNRFNQARTGRAVFRGSHGWILDMGGRYGTPAIATDANIVRIARAKGNKGNQTI
jgi:hypothetical protein